MNVRKINTIAQTWSIVWTHLAAMNVTASKDTRGVVITVKVMILVCCNILSRNVRYHVDLTYAARINYEFY